MVTTSFTNNFKLRNRYADNFIKGLTDNMKSNFKSKVVNDIEYRKVVSAFKNI